MTLCILRFFIVRQLRDRQLIMETFGNALTLTAVGVFAVSGVLTGLRKDAEFVCSC